MHYIASLLQYQLATDISTLQHLPLILTTLDPSHFAASSHLAKWSARISSLLHSKEPAFKWCGLCLAEKTAELNHELLMENAQTWIGLTLPFLSRNEAPPSQKAAIHLLLRIFSSTQSMPEFQRQVSSPNIPKFATALISLAEKTSDQGLKLVVLRTLNSLCHLYPTLMKQHQTNLYKTALNGLSGSQPTRQADLVTASAALHSTVHLTGGKVGGSTLWRKSVDSAVGTATECVRYLRCTFIEGTTQPIVSRLEHAPLPQDGMFGIPLALDRLRCATALIRALLSSSTVRAVPVPFGRLVGLTLLLLRSPTPSDGSHYDAPRRSLETANFPSVTEQGCVLLRCLALCGRAHLTPYASQLLDALGYHLRPPTLSSDYRVILLETISVVVHNTLPFHSTIFPSSLTKLVLPSVTRLLSQELGADERNGVATMEPSTNKKKGKKRTRAYEGDEVFKQGKGSYHLTCNESLEALAGLNVFSDLLQSGFLSSSMQSISKKVVLSLLLGFSNQEKERLSPDKTIHGKLVTRIGGLAVELENSGNGGWSASTLGTVVLTVADIQAILQSETRITVIRDLEQILHPRHPPLLRSLPPIESLSVSLAKGTKEERELKESLGLQSAEGVSEMNSQHSENITNEIPGNPVVVTPAISTFRPSEMAIAASLHSQTPQPSSIPSFSPFSASITSSIPLSTPTQPVAERLRQLSVESPVRAVDPVVSASSFIVSGSASGPPASIKDTTSSHDISQRMENSDDDDEALPEIDMRSDSEDE